MCGIFGYCHYCHPRTTRELMTTLINGLKRLEYRGYDSAGLCVDSGKAVGEAPVVVRQSGNVDLLRRMCIDENKGGVNFDVTHDSSVAIAHTRWATHGPPCEKNSHPHASKDSEFVICHNGILTNFTELRAFLVDTHGYVFVSETDSEVIAHLLHYLYTKLVASGKAPSFIQVAMECMHHMDGASAVVIKSKHFPGEVVGFKRGSPLIVGIVSPAGKRPVSPCRSSEPPFSHADKASALNLRGDMLADEIYISSDSNAIAEHTRQVVYLDDDDVVHFHDGVVRFYNKSDANAEVETPSQKKVLHELEVALETLTKGRFEHYMLKEIFEQPESVLNTMRGRLNFETGEVHLGGFASNKAVFRQAARLLFISCGTSLNSCLAVRPLFDELASLPVMVENASDFLDRRPYVGRSDVCFFVSQSGETADTLRAMEYCRDQGAVLVGITNVVGSAISRLTNFGAHLNAGVEVGVASTKAYTSQFVLMVIVALLLSENSVQLQPRRKEIVAALGRLSADIHDCIKKVEGPVKELAQQLMGCKSVLVLGRGYNYATCLEGALKIKELTYVHTEGINSGELKHGPLALIDENIPVIIVCTKDALIDRARSAIQQVSARKGRPIALTNDDDPEILDAASSVVKVPATVDCLQGVLNIIPLQLLAYHLAVLRGNNVDRPRNLAKSVTVQ